jgi:hypothetical protein
VPGLPTEICSRSESDIFKAKDRFDIWLYLGKEYFVALNNMNCPVSRIDSHNHEAEADYPAWLYEAMLKASTLLNSNCEMDYTSYSIYQEFLSSVEQLSKYSYQNMCCCTYEVQTCINSYRSDPDGTPIVDEFYLLEQLMIRAGSDPILFHDQIDNRGQPKTHNNVPRASTISTIPLWIVIGILVAFIVIMMVITVISICIRRYQHRDTEENPFLEEDFQYDSQRLYSSVLTPGSSDFDSVLTPDR